MDYSIFYKDDYTSPDQVNGHWDYFISAFNSSDRVNNVFDLVSADIKYWLVFPEYGFQPEEVPVGSHFLAGNDEAECMLGFLRQSGIQAHHRVCIDITGFIRPHLIFMICWLHGSGVKTFDAIYSEPSQYLKKEDTTFSDGKVTTIRQVKGFEGQHSPDLSNDILIIGSGYDDILISQVAENKNNAKKIQIFGLPSLRPEFYQQNILRAELASESVGRDTGEHHNSYFAPAYDPFVTANVIAEIINKERSMKQLSNIYLCPLATKAQVLGFTIFYLYELSEGGASIIFPFCNKYAKETSTGVSRIWKYTVELP